MSQRTISVLIFLLLATMLLWAVTIRPIRASGTIYIRANGGIEPVTAPIQREGNVYTFTDDIYLSIVVEKDNIVIDGASHSLEGPDGIIRYSSGITLHGRNNVTIKNVKIDAFYSGIWLYNSSNCIISGNNITAMHAYGSQGILLGRFVDGYDPRSGGGSSSNTISGNKITNSKNGITLDDRSSDNVISANQISNNYGNGILMSTHTQYDISLSDCSNNTISGNEITNNENGIMLSDSPSNTISGNNITANFGYGIILGARIYHTTKYGVGFGPSNDNIISENNITNNNIGLSLIRSLNNTLRNDIMADNNYNLEVSGNIIQHFVNDVDHSNTVDGKPVYYWINKRDMVVPLDAGYLALINCTRIVAQDLNLTPNYPSILLAFTKNSTVTRNKIVLGISLVFTANSTITRNNITNAGYGVWLQESLNNIISENNITNSNDGINLYYSSNNIVSRNKITENNDGIESSYSSNNKISENNITENRATGIRFYYCSNNTISGNNIINNGANPQPGNGGIHLAWSSDNRFYHNNFISNQCDVFFHSSTTYANFWDDGYPSGGNYWKGYKAVDKNGVGYPPLVINTHNQDNYPLMGPFCSFDTGISDYRVDFVSNSTISSFHFSPEEGPFICFNVTGPDDTVGFCRVTISNELIWCDNPEQWEIRANNTLIEDRTVTNDINFTFIYFTYNQSTKNVKVTGVHVIPEFPSVLIWSLLMVLVAVTVATSKKKRLLSHSKS